MKINGSIFLVEKNSLARQKLHKALKSMDCANAEIAVPLTLTKAAECIDCETAKGIRTSLLITLQEKNLKKQMH